MLLRRRKYESRRGFTLVELVVVLVILAILASVAVPAFSRQLETGRERKAVTEAQACVTAATGAGRTEVYPKRGRLTSRTAIKKSIPRWPHGPVRSGTSAPPLRAHWPSARAPVNTC